MRLPRPHASFLLLVLAGWIAPPVPASATEPFVVVAYNVENWVASAAKSEASREAAISIIAARQPAVIGVLEMGDRADFDDFRARLKARGLDYPHVEWTEGLDRERHVALVSRFPITARNTRDRVPFDVNGQPNGIQRGILDVTIEPTPGEKYRLIGLHLKSRRKVPEFDETVLRAKEAWFVRQHVDTILNQDPKTRLLVFGDLNDTRDQPPIREILGARGAPGRLTDIPLEDTRGERWTHYFSVADEYARIDYFLVSPALLPLVDRKKSGIGDSPNWRDASDHRALFLTIDSSAP